MSKVKLTEAQVVCLKAMELMGSMKAVDGYKPMRKLVELGFASGSRAGIGSPVYKLTDAGRSWLAARTLSDGE